MNRKSLRLKVYRFGTTKDLEGAETLQEKISKGIRDIFRAKRTSYDEFDEEEEENPEEEQKEMLKTPSSEEEY